MRNVSSIIGALVMGVVCLALTAGPLWAGSSRQLRQLSDEEIAKIEAAMPSEPIVEAPKRKLLVFWRCETFFHTSIPVVNKALEIMGEKTGLFDVVITDDYAVFTPERLAEFDAICLNNTTTLRFDPEKTPERCEALMDFVKGGKGIVGVHAATDNFKSWPEAQEMMGGKFTGHPWTSKMTVAIKIDDPDHPLTAPFKGQGFKIRDEIYRTEPPLYSRSKQRVLMSLDMSDEATRKVAQKPTDADTGISWIKTWGDGRVFYCSLGHNDEVFHVPAILQHYLAGIQFAFGDLEADATPKPAASSGLSEGHPMARQVQSLKTEYDWGQSRVALTQLSDHISASHGNETELKAMRTALLSVLESDATYAAKQYVFRELSLIGNDTCVPALGKMLTDEKLSDMARFALERIPGQAASAALMEYLDKTEGTARVGIVNSLGERRCTAAAPMIARLVDHSDKTLAGAAISALGKIGGPEAVAGLDKARDSASDDQKILIYDAYLAVADKMATEGDRVGARKIYVSLNRQGVPQPVRTAALRGIVTLAGSQ